MPDVSGGLSEQAMEDLARNDYVAMPSFRLRELEERAERAERALADCKEALVKIGRAETDPHLLTGFEAREAARECLARLGSEAGE